MMQIFTTSDYDNFMGEILDVKIKEKELVDKSGISWFIDNSYLDRKTANPTNNNRIKARVNTGVKSFCAHFHSLILDLFSLKSGGQTNV